MTRTLKRIAPLQAGKILGILYACMGLVFLPFFALAGLAGAFAQHQTNQGAGGAGAIAAGAIMGMGLFMPIFYGILGFFSGLIGAALYNVISRWVGGFQVEVE